ncbi:unnamed protein product [Blepharisma stoltei]|uniref:protein-serine/threonine phosphatase n=1 Tax=Blepharisma stoltei TaxID=1481888 RepID=A0AAU9K8K0_9CILI|nr:unnamed protein product [Blepharisma stoltei]
MEYQEVRQEILQSHGWELPEAEYTQDELKEFFRLSKSLPRLPDTFCEIPLSTSQDSNPSPRDPRLLDRIYRRTLYQAKPFGSFIYNSPLLSMKPLDIILDLDWTMIYAIHPSMQSKPLIDAEVSRLKSLHPAINFIPFYLQGIRGYMILAIRPNLKNFLNSLQRLGTLYVYTSADRDYAQAVLQIIDGSTRFFGNRIIATGLKKDEAHIEKSLDLLNFPNSENVVIIDDQVDVWRRQDQGCIIPSMRFAPCFSEDAEYINSKAYADRMKTYNYCKGVFGFKDDSVPFIENKGQQLNYIQSYVARIHQERFVSMYTKPTAEINMALRKTRFDGQKFSLEQVTGPERESKIASLRAIIDMLGGMIVEGQQDAIRVVETAESMGFNTNCITTKTIIDKYFGLS